MRIVAQDSILVLNVVKLIKNLMNGEFGPFTAVQPGEKLAATWGGNQAVR